MWSQVSILDNISFEKKKKKKKYNINLHVKERNLPQAKERVRQLLIKMQLS